MLHQFCDWDGADEAELHQLFPNHHTEATQNMKNIINNIAPVMLLA